jgi:hypothetical protein
VLLNSNSRKAIKIPTTKPVIVDNAVYPGHSNSRDHTQGTDTTLGTLTSDLLFSGAGSGLPYGEIYIDNGTETLTLTTSYQQVVNFDTQGADGLSNLMTPAAASNKMTITQAGTYRITASFSGKSTKVSSVYMAVFVDGVEKNNVEAEVNTVENGILAMTASGIVAVGANKDVDIRLKYSGAEAAVVTCAHVNLNAFMVGG